MLSIIQVFNNLEPFRGATKTEINIVDCDSNVTHLIITENCLDYFKYPPFSTIFMEGYKDDKLLGSLKSNIDERIFNKANNCSYWSKQ